MTDLKVTSGACWIAGVPDGEQLVPLAAVLNWPMAPKSLRAAQTLLRKVGEVVGDLDKVRVRLCEQHAKKDEAGAPVQANGAYVLVDEAAFVADWAELLAEEVVLPGCRAITDDEIPAARPTLLTLERLGPFLVEHVV